MIESRGGINGEADEKNERRNGGTVEWRDGGIEECWNGGMMEWRVG